jgi:hypothetical protein
MTQRKPPQGGLELSRFAALLDAYGGESEHWPEAERAAALALLERESEARVLLDAALALDSTLDLAVQPEAPAHLRARVLEIPIRKPQSQGEPWLKRWFGWRLAAAALVPCLIGFCSGALLWDNNSSDGGDELWSEVAQVSLPSDIFDEDQP